MAIDSVALHLRPPPAVVVVDTGSQDGGAQLARARGAHVIELTGNPGLSRKNPLERHYRDVLCSRIHSPQNDTILVGAGRAGFAL